MKTIPKILAMVLVVGLIAAIPASTQVLTGGSDTTSDENNLPLLILVNRLALSEDQMNVLDDILRELIAEKDAAEAASADFEQSMIEFNGTGEELDAMLAVFREEQVAAGKALRTSIESSLDQVRNLLSINQGLILQEVFPQLMGRILLGSDHGAPDRMFGTAPMAGNRLPGASAARSGMMGRPSSRDKAGMDSCSGECGDTAGSHGSQIPDQMMERLGGRLATVEGDRTATAMGQGRIADRGDVQQPGRSSLLMQRAQFMRNEGVDLFGRLEQMATVLERKLEAME